MPKKGYPGKKPRKAQRASNAPLKPSPREKKVIFDEPAPPSQSAKIRTFSGAQLPSGAFLTRCPGWGGVAITHDSMPNFFWTRIRKRGRLRPRWQTAGTPEAQNFFDFLASRISGDFEFRSGGAEFPDFEFRSGGAKFPIFFSENFFFHPRNPVRSPPSHPFFGLTHFLVYGQGFSAGNCGF